MDSKYFLTKQKQSGDMWPLSCRPYCLCLLVYDPFLSLRRKTGCGAVDPHKFFADPDPAVFNADPDPA